MPMATCYHHRMPHHSRHFRAARYALLLVIRAWEHFMERFDMRQRVGMGIRILVIMVAVAFVASGRPPAIGQERAMPTGVIATEDALQDRDIHDMQTKLIEHDAAIKDNSTRTYANSAAIDNLNTKWLCAMAVLAFLQSSGLLAQVLLKKKDGAKS